MLGHSSLRDARPPMAPTGEEGGNGVGRCVDVNKGLYEILRRRLR